jgi:4-amino-4-deoxy-L-arabinose transferase-like glycosyltransferase
MTPNTQQLRLWFFVTCALLLIQGLVFWFTPPLQVTQRATESTFAQVWPYIDQLEYENEDPQQGRALRWAPMQGSIRVPQSVFVDPMIVRMSIHTARAPDQPPMSVDMLAGTSTTSFLLDPGWRTISLLVMPSSYVDHYAHLRYKLTGPILSERRDLGLAVSAVSVTQGMTQRIDGIRWLFVTALWFWLIPLAVLRRWPVWYALLPAVTVIVAWWGVPQLVAYYLPNHWDLIGYMWLMTAVLVLTPYRRRVLDYRWLLVALAVSVVLWQSGFGWVGVVLMTCAWFICRPLPEIHVLDRTIHVPQMTWLILVGTVLIAGILRIALLNDYPTGLFRDEARHGGLAWRILAGEWMVYSPLANLPAGYFYVSAIPVALFDASAWSIRIVAAVVGTLSVPAIFWMVRTRLGDPIALWASVMLATLLWHVGLSRIGFPATMGPLLTIIAVGAWLRIPQVKRPIVWAVVAGVATGLMLMVYHSARLMPLVVALTVVLVLWQQQWAWRKLWLVFVVYVFVALIVASPIVWYAITQPDNYMRRIGVTSIMVDAQIRGMPVWVALFDNVHAYVGMLFVSGDQNPRHFYLGAPQLNGIESFAFLTGIIWLWRQHRTWLFWLLGWLSVGLLSGVLSVDAPHALRTVESIVPIVIIVAAGAYCLTQLVPSRWVHLLLVLVVIGNGIWSAVEYRSWQVHPRTQSRFDTIATNDVRFVQQFVHRNRPNTTFVYVPESMRRSDLGVFLLHNSRVRVWQRNPGAFDLNMQHIIFAPIDEQVNWTTPPVRLDVMPIAMQSRYQLWCVGSCDELSWIRQP